MPDVFTYTAVTRITPSGGSVVGGTPVTITGFGFDSFFTGSVTIGGVAATSIVVVSNTSITAVTPAHNAGPVDVVVSGIGTLTDGYTYAVVRTILPRVPVLDEKRTLDGVELAKFLMAVKKAIETAPVISGGQIVGPIAEDQIPELPWDRISKDGSSLADLETRSATALTSGVLGQPYGGTGRPNAYSFAPGSFTVADGRFGIIVQSLQLTGNQSATVQGSGILAVI